MSHFGDYMDGVPVKISDRYKKPPRIELPYSVTECPSRAQAVVDSVKYTSTFETNVLAKIKELRNAKETKKNERKHRLQLLEEEKQKKLDAIAAAEAEEKLKQLSVSEVSYPSTEEISEISPDDRTENNCDATLTQDENHENLPESTTNHDLNYFSSVGTSEIPPNILQPIQVQSNTQQSNLLDDMDPLHEYKMQANVIKPQFNNYSKHNIETLTYKDFENDTSSPFDNVELKTINDMELLAQVLQSQKESATSCNFQQYITDQTYVPGQNCQTQVPNDCVNYLPMQYADQPVQCPNVYTPQYMANGYYLPTQSNTVPTDVYAPSYQYYGPGTVYPNYCQPVQNEPIEMNQVSNSTYIPQYYYNYTPVPAENINYSPNEAATTSKNIKSRSRSVPDIVRELNEEINLRHREEEQIKQEITRQQNLVKEQLPAVKDQPSCSTEVKEPKRTRKKVMLHYYNKLEVGQQIVCKKIHGMGFPLDRVARVCQLIGDNDKKMIEVLLLVGELMDLGFSEDQVINALVKCQFNKDKALDELVS